MEEMEILICPGNITLQVEKGTTILDALYKAEVKIDAVCGGKGRCGKCRVKASGELSEVTPDERKIFSEKDITEGWRLACRAKIIGPVKVDIPESESTFEQILSQGLAGDYHLDSSIVKKYVELPKPELKDQRADLERLKSALAFKENSSLDVLKSLPKVMRSSEFNITAVLKGDTLIQVEPGDTTSKKYGIAFDIGTTTVVGFLMDLNNGREVAVASRMNAQAGYGADVISRINYSFENNNGLNQLSASIVQVINEIIDELVEIAEINNSDIYEVTIVGNTCMQHLLLGVSPESLAQSPYVQVIQDEIVTTAQSLGISINRGGYITLLPNIAGFVGADTVGVILASGIDKSDDITLAIDIGTNGEIVLAVKDRLVSCSTAAGPAFEGAQISCGMRGVKGAIESIQLNDDVLYSTIGRVDPKGICGSGLVDVIAELVQHGIVDTTGRICGPEEWSGPDAIKKRIVEGENGFEFVVANGIKSGGIRITQKDVRELQLAKGAINAGIAVLKDEFGITDEDIDRCLMAGAFGNYIKKESALRIGLIPSVPLERVISIGNAAGVGAKTALLSKNQRQRAREIARNTEYIELSGMAKFQEKFMMAMYF